MKQLSVFALVLLGILQSCKKEEDHIAVQPDPKVMIRFGYTDPGQAFGLKTYANQDEIPVDSVAAHDLFGVSIREYNLSSLNGFTADSGIFELDVFTGKDRERILNLEHNRSAYSSSGFGQKEFGGEIYFPYAIRNTAIQGNDTIEISDLGDLIWIHYQSEYTGLSGQDSIRITP